jgi:uncharacterized membrane protein
MAAGKAQSARRAARAAHDWYLYAALAMVLASVAYWTAFAFNAYGTFHEYSDLGSLALSMYYDIHYPGIVHGLQYMLFMQHISPDMLLLLPFFYADSSALTLLVIQAVVVSFAGLAAFAVARRLIKSQKAALLLCAAFLLNPGLHGLTMFDAHVEMLLPLAFILVFYFYMRAMRAWFFAASVFLLGVMEEAPFLGASLGLALLVYELLNRSNAASRRTRIGMALGLIVLSVAAFAFYSIAAVSLASQYASGAYPLLPPGLAHYQSLAFVLSGLHSFGSQSSVSTLSLMGSGLGPYAYYAIIVLLLSMGILLIFAPIESAILLSPWLVETFIAGNYQFVFMFNYYFAFAIGGMAVAAIIGAKNIMERKGMLARALDRHTAGHAPSVVAVASIAVVAMVLLLSPAFIYSKNINSFSQDFLFQANASQQRLYSQLYSVMALVPANASLMAQYYMMPHLFARRYIETTCASNYYFKPQYVLLDYNLNISLNVFRECGTTLSGIYLNSASDYLVVAQNGTALLLERAR